MNTADMLRPGNRAARLEAALTAALAPSVLRVEDESARHAGHSGAQPGGETHYRVEAVSERFAKLGRLERSRMVHTLLSDDFSSGLHALSLSLRSPDEV